MIRFRGLLFRVQELNLILIDFTAERTYKNGQQSCKYIYCTLINPDNPKQVLIECEDGNTYTHHDIK